MSDCFDHELDAYEGMYAYDAMFGDSEGWEVVRPTCKFCLKSGLEWVKVRGKWGLFDNGEPHICQRPMLPMRKEAK